MPINKYGCLKCEWTGTSEEKVIDGGVACCPECYGEKFESLPTTTTTITTADADNPPCCFIDQNRICEPTCMAFMRHESDVSRPPLLLKCVLLEGLNDLNAIRRKVEGRITTVVRDYSHKDLEQPGN